MSATNGHNPRPPAGAYPNEMPSPELDPTIRPFAQELRAALLDAPPAEVAEAQIQAMLAEARAMPTVELRSPRWRNRFAILRLAAAGAAGLVVLTAGLAVAGVRPPEPISDTLEAVGVDVPGGDDLGEPDGAKPVPDERDSSVPRDSNGAAAPGADGDGDAGQARHENRGRGSGAQGSAGQPAAAAAEGQETAQQAQSGNTPPTDPGRSEDHPSPPDNSQSPPAHSQGTPPDNPQADAPGQIKEGGNPHGGPPGQTGD